MKQCISTIHTRPVSVHETPMFILSITYFRFAIIVLSTCTRHDEFQVHAEADFKFNKNKQIIGKEFRVQYLC